ncbi:MAG: histidine kinase N-terminal 7TM domain-containing protein [Candidatus Binatia bacterium]|nr:histidine kinase N-terminal 7TM domain-containing protein [Candidatus Binatia bacterium]
MGNVVLNILYLLSLASMIPLATAVWRRRTAPGAPGLLVQIIGIAIWCFGYGLENASWTPWWKLLGTKIGYIGIVMVPLSWLMFTAKFLRGRPLPNGWIVGLAVIPAITLIAVWTNGLEGGLQWSRLEFDPPHLRLTPGPWYWVAYGYSTVVFVIATWSVIRGLSHSTKLMRRQARVLLAAALIPWIANVTYTTGLSPWPDVDLAPFAFGLAAVLVTWSLLRIGFLDLAPIARGIAVEQMRDGWIVVDHRGRVVDLNPAAERFLGRPTSLVNGCDLADILPEGPDALRLAHDKTGRLESAGIEIARGNLGDRRWYELRAWPLKERSGHFVGDMLVMQDRTESIVIARSLADARDLAQSADDAKSDFLATMSHEIRTPIHGILGMTEILLDSDLQDEQRECAERSRAATLNLLNIINDILDFSKIEAGKLILEREPFELRRVVDETLGLVATAAVEKKLALTSTIEPGVPEQVLGDVGRIRQILLNLVANAVKFTETGEVAVRVDACRNGGPKDRLHFEVRDTGIGIPDEAKEKLFESFSQVGPSIARNYGGTGLGLAIVKRLVEQMGGEVGFESAPGAGSTFWFRVPLAAETAGSTASGN